MNVRQMLGAWALALAILTGTMIGLVALAERSGRPAFIPGAIAVIGSSPTLFAVPGEGGGRNSLLGDGRPHRRLAKPLLTEEQTLTLLARALDAHAPVIFVEANPLLFDFAFAAHQRPCDGWKMRLGALATEARERLRGAFHGVRPPIVQASDPDPALMRESQAIDMTIVDGNYPLLLRSPCAVESLQALADRAHAQRARLVLVLPPRSPFATARIGTATEAALQTEAQALATRLGAELFVPGGDWTNPEFVDAAHVNAAGRRHFLAALRSWWAASR